MYDGLAKLLFLIASFLYCNHNNFTNNLCSNGTILKNNSSIINDLYSPFTQENLLE